jgi:hypothetical protein
MGISVILLKRNDILPDFVLFGQNEGRAGFPARPVTPL